MVNNFRRRACGSTYSIPDLPGLVKTLRQVSTLELPEPAVLSFLLLDTAFQVFSNLRFLIDGIQVGLDGNAQAGAIITSEGQSEDGGC